MNEADVIAALGIPPSARVDQRVPKKLLVENGAPTARDKRKIHEGIEEVFWLAALKPTTIGVPEFRDDTREYLEIAILRAALRVTAPTTRLTELIHRAVPYPVLLVTTQGRTLNLSLSHKRHSQAKDGATVLDGPIVIAEATAAGSVEVEAAFLNQIALARQPHANLYALYQGWIDGFLALRVASVTGTFTVLSSPQLAANRRTALSRYAQLVGQLAKLLASAARERQVSRKVAMNLEIRRIRSAMREARGNMN